MKKILVILLAFLLIGCNKDNETIGLQEEPTPLAEINVFEAESFTDPSLNYYQIEATLDVIRDVIQAEQTVTYTNYEDVDLQNLYFHLYPNAFTQDSHPSLFDTHLDEIDQQIGYVDVTEVRVNGETVDSQIGPIDTTLEIDYNFVKGETYTIKMTYEVGISTTSERFGVVDGIFNLGNWYPILAVYDEDGWNLDPYYSVGDPFYSDMSNYDVSVTVPEGYVIAASGYLYDQLDQTYHFRGDRMRDFAMIISSKFLIREMQYEDTRVYLYYPASLKSHRWIDDALKFGYEALELFDQEIGEYPYKTYSVVMTKFPSGMEYPGLVFIADDYFDDFNISNLRTTIVHETIHQWFYSLIGDDEIDEGWIDEGLTSFFTAYFDKVVYKEQYYNQTMSYYQDRIARDGLENIEVLKPLEEYADWGEYGVAAYVTPAVMYHELTLKYGDDLMLDFAKRLYDKYAYGILKEEGLRETLVEVYGQEVMEIFEVYIK